MEVNKIIKKIWSITSIKRKKRFFYVCILMIMSALLETASTFLVMPFISILMEGEGSISSMPLKILERLNLEPSKTTITIIFVAFVILTFAVKALLLVKQNKFAYDLGSELSTKMFQTLIYQNYSFYIKTNRNEILNNFSTKAQHIIISLVQPLLNIISIGFSALLISLMILIINPVVSIIAMAALILIYSLIYKINKRRLNYYSEELLKLSYEVLDLVDGALGNIRDIILDKSEKIFVDKFSSMEMRLRTVGSKSHVSAIMPRYMIEAFTYILMALGLYIAIDRLGYTQAEVIPLLGLYMMGVMRLAPLFQQAYSSWHAMILGKKILEDVVEYLNMEESALRKDKKDTIRAQEVARLAGDIHLRDISFKYESVDKFILKNVNATFKKNSLIGIIGESGGGKSTFLDMLMGFNQPNSGEILVSNIKLKGEEVSKYQKIISHVPQNIYIQDKTIAENIAIGKDLNEIDQELMKMVGAKTKIDDFVVSLKDKYLTRCGSNGALLSGGQRQRIGIARALYKKSQYLFLDEATSALDENTERELINMISDLRADMTIFMVTHKQSILDKCNEIYEVRNNTLLKIR